MAAGRHAVAFRGWSGAHAFAAGTFSGTEPVGDLVVMAHPTGVVDYDDPFGTGGTVAYETASWTSPWVDPPFAFTELVASWAAQTPGGGWIEVAADVSDGDAEERYVLGRWAESTADIHPTSVAGQHGALARTECDVLLAHAGVRFTRWRLVVTFARRPDTSSPPRLSMLAAMASTPSTHPSVADDPRARTTATLLDVPAFSQQRHRGRLPELNGGGQSWCSPASTAMVLAYYGRGPSDDVMDWVDDDHPDPQVAHAASRTFDHAYNGAGNWSFNTAYAALFGLDAFVTRLRGLGDAERFIVAGIPLIASVAFTSDQLAGSGYDTEGHLLVIAGFTAHGDVIVNDPASHGVDSNDEVRTVYDRAEFERAWLDGSGGIVYVIHPPEQPLPDLTSRR